jgi:membrane protease YdiL (CAAX protease family)
MFSAGVLTAFWAIIGAIFFLVGLYIYISLIRQISVRAASAPASGVPPKTFGLPEAIIAALLISLLVLSLVASASTPGRELSNTDLINNLVLTIVIVMILIGFLALRGFDINALAGFSKLGIVRAAAMGAVLLFFAYPLVSLAEAITEHFIGRGSSRQNIVELFSGAGGMQQRVIIIVLAVAVAPVAEELVFRFFLYGVLKRYFGIMPGLVISSLLFAAVHQHLPSFGPLFILGCCFTLAYEWSGSILVPMTMHSLFNSLSLVLLAFPELFQQ